MKIFCGRQRRLDDEPDLPDWQKDEREIAKRIVSTDRYRVLPTKIDLHEWGIIQKFSRSVESAGCAKTRNSRAGCVPKFPGFRAPAWNRRGLRSEHFQKRCEWFIRNSTPVLSACTLNHPARPASAPPLKRNSNEDHSSFDKAEAAR